MDIAKYFWDLNEKALKETKMIFRTQHTHPKFMVRLVTLLSRCDRPKELLSILSEKEFIEIWPKVRVYWRKIQPESDFRDWWETVYEQILQKYKAGKKMSKGDFSSLFFKIGKIMKDARIEKGLSQNDLALKVGMKQPDISKIEEGKKNITIETLAYLCKTLGIKSIKLFS